MSDGSDLIKLQLPARNKSQETKFESIYRKDEEQEDHFMIVSSFG